MARAANLAGLTYYPLLGIYAYLIALKTQELRRDSGRGEVA